ncbi:MAG: extracellular solute-binding protein [Lachnospiraceae bacterium]|jgi:raffinose/stachyose/melibiose transport system substrate-binding protein|nr:extracellular solute-binding protein [Lachnospiraceae bacterium]MCI9599658.1 extracellular solute-binding protein [Lachnospiraceae bacterium]
MKKSVRRAAVFMLGVLMCAVTACGQKKPNAVNLADDRETEQKTVYLFGSMEKSKPNAKNTARSAADLTIMQAEEKLGLEVEYRTYTAENYQEKTYDDVALDRARNAMDDLYLLNPDTIKTLGVEGKLADLSGLKSAENLREVVKTANTIGGKLVAIPQEIVVYGLFVNKDMFDRYGLALPEKPEELLECCRVFKENGIETPIGANRWWLETFVLAQAYADLYNGGNTEAEIEALNNNEARYSDYMRPGFEYLKKMMDLGYIDAEAAYTYEAIEGEGPDFLAQKTPIVMAYWGAANSSTAYGNPDFHMQVIGFPSAYGQMPVVSMTGYGIAAGAEHLEDAMNVLDIITSDEALELYSGTNQVISPSRNVEVDCVEALKPLRDRFNEGVYVLGSNAGMELEQWGNTCLIVRELLQGASVDECMAEFDRLQDER